MSSQHQALASAREKLFWTALLLIGATAGFLYVDTRNAVSSGNGRTLLPLETALDAHVPFVPQFIFGYALYYLWVLLPLFVLRTRDAFFRALGAFGLTQLIAQTMFIFYPSHIVRPQVEGEGVALELVRLLYRLDPGWNLFPSLHVAHTLVVALLVAKFARPAMATAVWAGTLLIWTSTVLIKQHFVIDILGGALLGWLSFAIAYRPLPRVRDIAWHSRNEAQ